MASKVDSTEYWIRDAIRNVRYAAELADRPETARFADFRGVIFAAWQAIRIAEDLGAEMLKPLAAYKEEVQCLTC